MILYARILFGLMMFFNVLGLFLETKAANIQRCGIKLLLNAPIAYYFFFMV